MKYMAGRKRHSAEDIVRKLRRADELAAAGKTGEEIAAELGGSAGPRPRLVLRHPRGCDRSLLRGQAARIDVAGKESLLV
jgi:hypothetical protein